MYPSQISGINKFAQNLENPAFKQQHDQHYAAVKFEPPTAQTQVAKAEPGVLDKVKTFAQQMGQNISNVIVPPAQAVTSTPKPSFAPGSQGMPMQVKQQLPMQANVSVTK